MTFQLSSLRIRTKILISSVLTLVLISLFILAYYPAQQKRQIYNAMQQKDHAVAEMIGLGVGIGMGTGDFVAITEALDWAKKEANLNYIVVLDENNEVIASYNPRSIELDIQHLLIKDDIMEIDGHSLHAVNVPIIIQDVNYGTLLFGSSLEEVNRAISGNAKTTLEVSLAILFLGLALSVYFSRLITKPLARLRDAADEVGRGNKNVAIDITGTDEVGVLGIAFKEMIKSVRQAEEQAAIFRQFAEASGQGLAMATPDGEITYANPSLIRLMGEDKLEDLIGKTFVPYYPEELQQRMRNEILPAVMEKGHWVGELAIKSTDGRLTPTLESIFLIRDENGNPLCLADIMIDITERKRAEEILKRQAAFVKNNPGPVLNVEKNGYILSANPATKAIFEDDLIGELIYEKFPKITQSIINVPAGLEPVQIEEQIGNMTYLFAIRLDESTNTVFVYGTNITERKRAEKALQKRTYDLGERVKEINCLYLTSELIGTRGISLEEIFHGTIDLIPPAWQYPDITCARIVLEGREFKAKNFVESEWKQACEIVACDENVGSIEVYYGKQMPEFDEGPFLKEEKNLLLHIGERLGSAIEQKRAEKALQESEERYRGLVENIDIGISLISPQMEILSLNRKMQEWFPGIDLSKKPLCYDVYNLSTEKQICSNGPAVMTLKDGKVHEAIIEAPEGGEVRSFRIVSSPIKDMLGDIVAAIEMVEDITEKLMIQKELTRTDKLESIGMLAGGIAHDFNNLLAGFMGNISLAKMEIDPRTKAYDALERAEAASVRAKRLTLQLLTFAKGGAPVKERASIQELIKDAVSFALSGSNIRCDFLIPDDAWEVTVDKGQIGQVIRNLVQNAAQAMIGGGFIRISVENLLAGSGEPNLLDRCKYLKISVQDHGVGIAEEHIQKIFEPYFTTKQQGSGLGLPAVYSIVKNHDGHIDVDSELGVGTTFHVYIPATECEISAEPTPEAEIVSGKGKVLVMDDEEMIREMLEDLLEIIGYDAKFTSDGAEAIELFKKERDLGQPFDILIMDLTIPGGMGGKEAMARIREIDSEVKAIVSSGYSSDPVVADFRKYGFTGYLNKPYNASQLSSVLDDALHSECIERDLK